MKINLVSLTMFTAGALLLYSAVKGYDPRSVIRWALGGDKPVKLGTAPKNIGKAPRRKKPKLRDDEAIAEV